MILSCFKAIPGQNILQFDLSYWPVRCEAKTVTEHEAFISFHVLTLIGSGDNWAPRTWSASSEDL